MSRCSYDKCEAAGTFEVEIVMYSPRSLDPGKQHPVVATLLRAGTQMPVCLCQIHKEKVRVEDYLSDEAWDSIAKGFREVGRAVPARDRTELRFRQQLMN